MSVLTDQSEMTFGKYKDTKLANVPAYYLIRFYENNKPLMNYIRENMDSLTQEKSQSDSDYQNRQRP